MYSTVCSRIHLDCSVITSKAHLYSVCICFTIGAALLPFRVLQVDAGCDPLAPNASGLYLPHLAARHASQNVLRKLIQWEERRSGNGSRVLLWKDAEGALLLCTPPDASRTYLTLTT